MITINDTIQYVKRQCGYPKVSVELSDEDIIDIIKHETLYLFQKYIPDIGRRVIKKGSKKFRIKKNLYWVIDPNDREVFWVQSVEPEESEMLANYYPYTMPLVRFDSIPELLDRTSQAHTVMRFGKTLQWWQEAGTNRLWIFSQDGISTRYSVSYTRSHAPDLSSINGEYVSDFLNLAAAQTMIVIGNIRAKYASLGTPIADINLGADLASKGETMLNNTIEELKRIQPIFVTAVIYP